jgi:hypothetical protein
VKTIEVTLDRLNSVLPSRGLSTGASAISELAGVDVEPFATWAGHALVSQRSPPAPHPETKLAESTSPAKVPLIELIGHPQRDGMRGAYQPPRTQGRWRFDVDGLEGMEFIAMGMYSLPTCCQLQASNTEDCVAPAGWRSSRDSAVPFHREARCTPERTHGSSRPR